MKYYLIGFIITLTLLSGNSQELPDKRFAIGVGAFVLPLKREFQQTPFFRVKSSIDISYKIDSKYGIKARFVSNITNIDSDLKVYRPFGNEKLTFEEIQHVVGKAYKHNYSIISVGISRVYFESRKVSMFVSPGITYIIGSEVFISGAVPSPWHPLGAEIQLNSRRFESFALHTDVDLSYNITKWFQLSLVPGAYFSFKDAKLQPNLGVYSRFRF